MISPLSPSDITRIGEAATPSILAVERELIRFGLEMAEGETPDAGDVGNRG